MYILGIENMLSIVVCDFLSPAVTSLRHSPRSLGGYGLLHPLDPGNPANKDYEKTKQNMTFLYFQVRHSVPLATICYVFTSWTKYTLAPQ